MNTDNVTTEAKLLKLIQRLHAKTKAGEIEWERTTSEDTFQLSFTSYIVRLSFRGTGSGNLDYYLTIRNESGVTVEQTNDVEIEKEVPGAGAYTWMSELHSMARRQALGVEKALDSLFDELA
jgi:hypothetical protein